MEGFEDAEEEEEERIQDRDEELYSTDELSIKKICHISTEPIDKQSVKMDSIDSMLIAKEHIIICGISQNLIDFIKPLRSKHLMKMKCPSIVILNKEEPDDKLWSTIFYFEQIYIIKGDPLNKQDLVRAGIRDAKKVVILAPSLSDIKESRSSSSEMNKNKDPRKLTSEEEDLLDSKTVFKYNMISKIKKEIFIVIELINPKNITFLYNKGREDKDEFKFLKMNVAVDGTASFASGEVYFSSIMDNLMVQAYYNQSLLDVLKKLVIGEDQSAMRNKTLSKYKNVMSSNLYLIDIPKVVYEDNEEDITHNINEVDSLNKKLIFSDAYNCILKNYKMIILGVYRLFGNKINNGDESNNFYYVVTSPPGDMELSSKDKLYVLSQHYPSEEFLGIGNRADPTFINRLNNKKQLFSKTLSSRRELQTA